jgi:hypothetical protein
LADEHRDRHYLLVDGVDGHAHYVDIGRGDAVATIREGSIVRVSAANLEVRDADRVVVEVASANGGRYSTDLHLRHDPSATQSFAEAHVHRLEAMRRAGVGVDRDPDGSWTIAADHADRASAYEARRHRDQPVEVETLSSRPIDQLPSVDAATWVDRELASKTPLLVRDSGFGRDVRAAMAGRRQWLIARQLADLENGQVQLRETTLAVLQRRELLRVAGDLSGDLGKPFAEARTGSKVEGRIVRPVDLVSGRFAIVENSKEFTLVPWRPVLENKLGRTATGIVRADGVSWSFARGRTGPAL